MITVDIHPEPDDRLEGLMIGTAPFPVLKIADAAIFPPADAAAWLRRLAVAAEELAEQVELAATDRPGLALAERHMAEAMAKAGIGGQR